MPSGSKLVLVDVGGLGGIQAQWLPFIADVQPVVFEPNSSEAAAIRPEIEAQGGLVVEKALGSSKRTHTLNIAASLGCTSILQANSDFLAAYSIAPAFEVRQSIEVECVRYDELFFAGEVPAPDALKIDVQGFELEVLRGFGSLLDGCLAVCLEAHFYPLYKRQPLLGDLVAYLAEFGLVLRRIEPVQHFDGDMVEVDAWFSISEAKVQRLEENRLRHMSLIETVWQLPPRRKMFSPNQFDN